MMKLKLITTKVTALSIAAILAVTGLTACGSKTTSESSSKKEASVDSENNTIKFAIQPGTIRTAIVILANELGYYKEEGVNVEFPETQDGTATLTAISSGKSDVDVLGTGVVPDLTFIANGSDLVIFGGTAAEGGAIISKPEDVDKFKDLKNYEGIKAAMVRGDSAWVVTRAKLLEEGVDVDSIQLVEVDSQANVAQAVAKGEAEVGFLPIEFANSYADIGIEQVYQVGELSPLYVCCRQVTSKEKLEEKHDAFVKFTKANLRAWEYYSDEANQDDIVKKLADFSGQDEDYVKNYLFVNRTVLTLDPNKEGIETYYQSLKDSGFFEDDTKVDIDDHIDTEIYKTALDELIKENPDDAFYQEQLTTFNEYNK